jgi:hypothetical protein
MDMRPAISYSFNASSSRHLDHGILELYQKSLLGDKPSEIGPLTSSSSHQQPDIKRVEKEKKITKRNLI